MNVRTVALSVGVLLSATFLSIPGSVGSPAAAQPAAQAGAASGAPHAVRYADGKVDRKSPKHRWHPRNNRAYFNNPLGDVDHRFAIQRVLVKAIENTPDDGIIRIAVYSFDRPEVGAALIAARNRGVRIQLLMNDHQVTRVQSRLYYRLGKNTKKQNFAYECRRSCRGGRDYMHSKFFLFSKTGGVKHVIMLGSQNFTLNALKHQWNDLLSMTEQGVMFDHMVDVFNDMRHDYSTNQPYETFCAKVQHKLCSPTKSTKFLRVFPRKSNAKNDAVLKILNPITCVYRSKGKTLHTHLRLSMHTMRGPRGDYLAERLRHLWASGCDVKVIYGLMGARTKSKLGAATARGRIPLRSAGFDTNGDLEVDRYTHQKYFTIKGMYDGARTKMAFTGSSNWSTRGTSGDEIIFSLRNPKVWREYQSNFNFMYNSSRNTRNSYTTTATTYRTFVTTRGPDGTVTKVPVIRQGRTQVNVPDHILATGPKWEDD